MSSITASCALPVQSNGAAMVQSHLLAAAAWARSESGLGRLALPDLTSLAAWARSESGLGRLALPDLTSLLCTVIRESIRLSPIHTLWVRTHPCICGVTQDATGNHQAMPSGSQHQLKTETTPAWTPRHGLGHARTSLRPRGRLGCQVNQSGHAFMRLHPRLLLPAARARCLRTRFKQTWPAPVCARGPAFAHTSGKRRTAAQAHKERCTEPSCAVQARASEISFSSIGKGAKPHKLTKSVANIPIPLATGAKQLKLTKSVAQSRYRLATRCPIHSKVLRFEIAHRFLGQDKDPMDVVCGFHSHTAVCQIARGEEHGLQVAALAPAITDSTFTPQLARLRVAKSMACM